MDHMDDMRLRGDTPSPYPEDEHTVSNISTTPFMVDEEHVLTLMPGPPAESGVYSAVDSAMPSVMGKSGAPRAVKKKVIPKRSWLKVDQTGEATVIQADKNRITHKLGVQARDLRIMDPNLATSYPSAILCRDKAMVVNLEYIKAIITTSFILVVNPEDESTLPFVTDLKLKLSQPQISTSASFATLGDALVKGPKNSTTALAGLDMPFELRALEVCLDSVCSYFERLRGDLEAAAYPALDALTHQVTSHNLERVRRIKSRLVRLTTRVETMREVLEKFLDDDEDMHDMNLTAKEQDAQEREHKREEDAASSASDSSRSSNSSSDSDDEEVAEVEVLLEVYFMQVDNTFNKLQTLNEYIEDTEDLVNLKLDQHRNQLICIDLFLTAFTTCLAMVTTIAGLFGMNLNSQLEDTEGVFNMVSITSCAAAVLFFICFVAFIWWKKLLVY